MRILILSQWFDPEPTAKGLLFAKELTRRGHSVEVLTGFPNYPIGRFYPGYRCRLWQRDNIDDVSVIRVPLYPSHDRSVLRRGATYLSFAAAAAIMGPALLSRPDVIYAYQPPATIAIPAFWLRWIFGAPLVYDVQDLWPDTLASTGMLGGRRLLGGLSQLCRTIYRSADRVAVLSPGMRKLLIERGVEPDKIQVIYNWCLSEAQESRPVEEALFHTDAGAFNVVFGGNMGPAQKLDTVLQAAAQCAQCMPQVRFHLIGSGLERETLIQRAAELRLPNVTFVDSLPASSMPAVYSQADALLVHLRADPLFEITIPSKTQAYLAAGRPIIMAVRGDASDLVQSAGAGISCTPEDPAAIVFAIKQLLAMGADRREQMGTCGREVYWRELSLKVGVDRFEALFSEALLEGKKVPHRIRRLLDVFVAAAILLFALPLFWILAIVIRLRMGPQVIYRQVRPGFKGRSFTIFKFRTMTVKSDRNGVLLPDAQRLTTLGRFLRLTSLDELPEFWNVLKGDMSLVGPRPLLPEYLPRYTAEQRRRHEVKPGITGWAQVNGRNSLSWEERLALDVWYVDNRSFALDLKILWMTLRAVLRRTGISAEGHATMPEFQGTHTSQQES